MRLLLALTLGAALLPGLRAQGIELSTSPSSPGGSRVRWMALRFTDPTGRFVALEGPATISRVGLEQRSSSRERRVGRSRTAGSTQVRGRELRSPRRRNRRRARFRPGARRAPVETARRTRGLRSW